MNIGAESIQRKEFHVVFKGYKPEEVDKFLDILAVEFDRLQKKNRELQEQLDKLKFEGDRESAEMKKVIQDALVSAHRIAEEIKQKARQEADKLINSKRFEEESLYSKLLDERINLEKSIKLLKLEYENFKEKVMKFTEEFKEKALDMGKEEISDLNEINEKKNNDTSSTGIASGAHVSMAEDIDEDVKYDEKKKIELESLEEKSVRFHDDSNEKNFEEEISLESYISKDEDPLFDEEDSREKDKFLKKTKEIGFYEIDSTSVQDEGITADEEDEKDGEEDEEKKEVKEAKVEDRFEELSEEDYEDGYRPKRARKKIDIANPDIINDFFKADED